MKESHADDSTTPKPPEGSGPAPPKDDGEHPEFG